MSLMRDVRWSFRNLLGSPGFAAAAILTFGLGIGVNLAVLAIVDRMMFRPLPYGNADELVHLHNLRATQGPSPRAYLPKMITEALQSRSTSFDGIATVAGSTSPTTLDGIAGAIQLNQVSQNLLNVLKVRPVAGRDFTPEDANGGMLNRPILLTDETWQSRFDRSPDVLTQSFTSGRFTYRVVGILPKGFLVPASSFEARVDGVVVEAAPTKPAGPGELGPSALGRLKPGVTLAQAEAEIGLLLGQMKQQQPSAVTLTRTVSVQPLRSGLFQYYRPYVWLIVAAVGAVFLVACVNLATLFLARGRSREQDAAIRSALGASRAQIVRSSLAEASVLRLISSTAAVAVAYATADAILAIVPPAFRAVAVTPLDPRLLIITTIAALTTALLAGGIPAIRASRVDVTAGLRREGRSTGSRLRGGSSLLAIESAFGVFLVAGAAVTVQSFLGLVMKSPGYNPANLYEASVQHGYVRGQQSYPPERIQRALDTIRSFPGVAGAGAVSLMPVGHSLSTRDEFWSARGTEGMRLGVSSGFFAALRTPILAGRELTSDDLDQKAMVAIVSQSAARHLFPSASPGDVIGQTVVSLDGPRTIVGVVADMNPLPGTAPSQTLYVPLTAAEAPSRQSAIPVAIRVREGHTLDAAGLRARLDEQFSPNGFSPTLVSKALQLQMQQPRFQAMLFGAVALIGLLLAAIGLYAVAAFDVARRRREMGIRLSLGATAADLRRLVIGAALRPVVIGAAAGLVGAWWTARYLQAFVFEVDARSPWTLAVVASILMITAVIAAWRPAQRAARTDPTTVLRAL